MELTEERVRKIVREEFNSIFAEAIENLLEEAKMRKPPGMTKTRAALLRANGKDPMAYDE